MPNRPLLCLVIILIGGSLLRSLAAEENRHEERSMTTEASADNPMAGHETRTEILLKKGIVAVTKKQNRSSISMIIGGQSEDGLAKKIALPVNSRRWRK